MVETQTTFGKEMLTLAPAQAADFGRANRALGALALLGRLLPLWPQFSSGPLVALAAVEEARLAGRPVELSEMLALGPRPQPVRPPRELRRAVGRYLVWRELAARPADQPLDRQSVARLHQDLEAHHLVRGAEETPPSPAPELPGAGIWLRAPAWRQAGLPALGVVALALAAWEREGPPARRQAAGRVLAAGLARSLGLPPAGFWLLGPALAQAAPANDLQGLYRPLRSGLGWRPWLETFLRAAAGSASRALELGLGLHKMLAEHRELIQAWLRAPRHPLLLLELLAQRVVLDLPTVSQELAVTHRTAGLLMEKLGGLKLTAEITGQQRGRRYAYQPLLELLQG